MALPPLYSALAAGFLPDTPPETEARCDACAMVPSAGRAPGDTTLSFDPVTRCCTFYPELPNFIVGRILAEPDPTVVSGRRSVNARLRNRPLVSPLGLGRPAAHSVVYRSDPNHFGRNRTLRCPHHQDDGSCGIWAHRPAVCATWFCKYVRGRTGQAFWQALETLLRLVERRLAFWAAAELGINPTGLAQLLLGQERPVAAGPAAGTEPRTPEQAVLWGRWEGRERAFFRACGRIVSRLSWDDVLRIAGPEIPVLAEAAKASFERLRSRDLPPRLRVGELRVVRSSPTADLVLTYSAYDPLRLSRDLREALPFFDGRPVGDALADILRHKRLRPSRELLVRLVDFGVLVPAAGPVPEPPTTARD